MSNTPYMPVFIGDLIRDTQDLSAEEFGAYCLLLFATWAKKGEPLADNDTRLARTCRVTVKRWRDRLRPALVGFFDLSAGTWRQKRLEKEWNFVEKQVEQKRIAGKASARSKALKSKKTEPTAVPPPLPTASQQRSNNPHSHPEEDSEESKASSAAVAASADEIRIVHPEPIEPIKPVAIPVPMPPRDRVKEAFDLSIEIFGPRGRTLVGKAFKQHKNELIVLEALYATRDEALGDPIPYFIECLNRRNNVRRSAHAAEFAAFDAVTRYPTIQ